MIDEKYFKVDRYSNSFLTLIKTKINGSFIAQDLQDKKEYNMFGKQFENLLQYDIPSDNKVIQNMVRVTNQNPVYRSLADHPNLKVQHECYGKFRELNFKIKADMLIKGVIVPDLKTTAARSQTEFEKSVDMFDYDRQMYVYMRVAKVNKSLLIGVSKQKNPQVYIVPINYDDTLYKRGKLKTDLLINVLKTLIAK